MNFSVITVQPLKNYLLQLTFKTGEQKIFDMKPYLDLGIFKDLKNETMFNTASIGFDTVEWANKADIDPKVLYQKSYKIK